MINGEMMVGRESFRGIYPSGEEQSDEEYAKTRNECYMSDFKRAQNFYSFLDSGLDLTSYLNNRFGESYVQNISDALGDDYLKELDKSLRQEFGELGGVKQR